MDGTPFKRVHRSFEAEDWLTAGEPSAAAICMRTNRAWFIADSFRWLVDQDRGEPMTAQKAHVCKRAIPVGERYRRLRGRDARINVKAHERRATRSAARGRRHEGDRRSANWSCRFRSLAVLETVPRRPTR